MSVVIATAVSSFMSVPEPRVYHNTTTIARRDRATIMRDLVFFAQAQTVKCVLSSWLQRSACSHAEFSKKEKKKHQNTIVGGM